MFVVYAAHALATSLAFADEAASHLADNVTVVLQEGDGVDYCAVVSSLTQLMLDPYFRTISGFQSLIQKEWIALGHPFCDRFKLVRPGREGKQRERERERAAREGRRGAEAQAAPVFLLFLDCAWQLAQRHPAAFQFSETYLTTLWDAAHNHFFDTFLFNCPRDRDIAFAKNLVQRPVWDWGEQFSDADKALFENPLYSIKMLQEPLYRLKQPTSASPLGRLEPLEGPWTVAHVEVWSQCYERWLSPLDVGHAGPAQGHVLHACVLAQIKRLSERVNSLSIMNDSRPKEDDSNHWLTLRGVSRFYPFGVGRAPPLPPQELTINPELLLDSQSLLNAPD
ncbi:hypothetical protein ACJJTC_017069 [Scirpophaga incertulas]